MSKLRWVPVLVCLCCSGLWAQGASQVFVSTGSAGIIYSLNTSNGALTTLISSPGADFEGMVVAPNNFPTTAGQSNSDETTYYLVYVCDTANSKIWRFDPTAATPQSTLESIFDNSVGGPGLTHPQCGRITSTGDLVVSSTVAKSGLWIFSGVSNVALGQGGGAMNNAVRAPTQLVGAVVNGSGEGVAQKNQGDLLVVDNTNGNVLRTPLAPAATTTFISGLSQPFGIARRGDGGIFVDTHANKPTLVQYNAQGANPTTCMSFKNNTPNFMQMALDNTLYVAVAANSSGTVRSINANTCQQNQSFSIPQPAVGIALPPTMTTSQNVSATSGTAIVNFGFTAFELNQIAGGGPCSGSISVGLASPAAITTLINNAGGNATPAVNLGLDGFEAMFSTANLNGCAAGNAGSGVTNFQLSNLLSSEVVNPEIVVCTEPNADPIHNPTVCDPQNTSLAQIGGWPIGGYLPNDLTGGGSKSLKCRIFMANALPVNGAAGQEPGIFCGFESPLSNTFTGTLNSWNLALAANITDGKSVPVKIKLANANGSCQNGSYITDATAILAVAQILDSKGNNVFIPIGLVSNGSSGLGQPLFKGDNNQQYLFNWASSSCIMPSGVTQVCPKGTYSVTVLFLTNNTAGGAQSIYGAQTTLVNLK